MTALHRVSDPARTDDSTVIQLSRNDPERF
ncbi:MAG: hypothetical protein JWN52_3074, partial [Actinomycetia bacterium]|nr:hypothetical protein [Actinomycetes bacterium]